MAVQRTPENKNEATSKTAVGVPSRQADRKDGTAKTYKDPIGGSFIVLKSFIDRVGFHPETGEVTDPDKFGNLSLEYIRGLNLPPTTRYVPVVNVPINMEKPTNSEKSLNLSGNATMEWDSSDMTVIPGSNDNASENGSASDAFETAEAEANATIASGNRSGSQDDPESRPESRSESPVRGEKNKPSGAEQGLFPKKSTGAIRKVPISKAASKDAARVEDVQTNTAGAAANSRNAASEIGTGRGSFEEIQLAPSGPTPKAIKTIEALEAWRKWAIGKVEKFAGNPSVPDYPRNPPAQFLKIWKSLEDKEVADRVRQLIRFTFSEEVENRLNDLSEYRPRNRRDKQSHLREELGCLTYMIDEVMTFHDEVVDILKYFKERMRDDMKPSVNPGDIVGLFYASRDYRLIVKKKYLELKNEWEEVCKFPDNCEELEYSKNQLDVIFNNSRLVVQNLLKSSMTNLAINVIPRLQHWQEYQDGANAGSPPSIRSVSTQSVRTVISDVSGSDHFGIAKESRSKKTTAAPKRTVRYVHKSELTRPMFVDPEKSQRRRSGERPTRESKRETRKDREQKDRDDSDSRKDRRKTSFVPQVSSTQIGTIRRSSRWSNARARLHYPLPGETPRTRIPRYSQNMSMPEVIRQQELEESRMGECRSDLSQDEDEDHDQDQNRDERDHGAVELDPQEYASSMTHGQITRPRNQRQHVAGGGGDDPDPHDSDDDSDDSDDDRNDRNYYRNSDRDRENKRDRERERARERERERDRERRRRERERELPHICERPRSHERERGQERPRSHDRERGHQRPRDSLDYERERRNYRDHNDHNSRSSGGFHNRENFDGYGYSDGNRPPNRDNSDGNRRNPNRDGPGRGNRGGGGNGRDNRDNRRRPNRYESSEEDDETSVTEIGSDEIEDPLSRHYLNRSRRQDRNQQKLIDCIAQVTRGNQNTDNQGENDFKDQREKEDYYKNLRVPWNILPRVSGKKGDELKNISMNMPQSTHFQGSDDGSYFQWRILALENIHKAPLPIAEKIGLLRRSCNLEKSEILKSIFDSRDFTPMTYKLIIEQLEQNWGGPTRAYNHVRDALYSVQKLNLRDPTSVGLVKTRIERYLNHVKVHKLRDLAPGSELLSHVLSNIFTRDQCTKFREYCMNNRLKISKPNSLDAVVEWLGLKHSVLLWSYNTHSKTLARSKDSKEDKPLKKGNVHCTRLKAQTPETSDAEEEECQALATSISQAQPEDDSNEPLVEEGDQSPIVFHGMSEADEFSYDENDDPVLYEEEGEEICLATEMGYTPPICALKCKEKHFLDKCPLFKKMEPRERGKKAYTLKRCLNCLNPNHETKDCKSKYNCSKCNNRHHWMLCYARIKKPEAVKKKPS